MCYQFGICKAASLYVSFSEWFFFEIEVSIPRFKARKNQEGATYTADVMLDLHCWALLSFMATFSKACDKIVHTK